MEEEAEQGHYKKRPTGERGEENHEEEEDKYSPPTLLLTLLPVAFPTPIVFVCYLTPLPSHFQAQPSHPTSERFRTQICRFLLRAC